MLTALLILCAFALAAYVAILRSRGVEWEGMLCAFVGHGTPYQRGGTRHFECPRCKLAMGGIGPTSRSTPDARIRRTR